MRIHRKLLPSFFFGLILSSTGKAALAQTAPELTVLVYNFSQATPELLGRAERETQRIFAQAGVHIGWTDWPDRKGFNGKAGVQ